MSDKEPTQQFSQSDHDVLIEVRNDMRWVREKIGWLVDEVNNKADKEDVMAVKNELGNMKIVSSALSAVVAVATSIAAFFTLRR